MLPLTEPFSRFIYKKEWILNINQVAAAAFMPHHVDGKTSLWYIAGLTEAEIMSAGVERMSYRKRPIPLLGRADLVAETVYNQGLDIELDMPRSRHANICRWPAEEEATLELALQLALGSNLHVVS